MPIRAVTIHSTTICAVIPPIITPNYIPIMPIFNTSLLKSRRYADKANMSETIYTGRSNPAAATGDIIKDRLGTPRVATTGKPPFPIPTKIADRMIKVQKKAISILISNLRSQNNNIFLST